jgi:hypothetical protein
MLQLILRLIRRRGGNAAAFVAALLFITAVPIIKLFAWGEGDSGGDVL